MTDDYKDTLLKYFSGNLTKDNVTPIYYNFPQFQETTSNESNIYSYIYSNVGVGFTELGILQGYNSTYSVIYGNDSNNKGFMVILDETNTPVQFINEYSSGTAFGKFQILNVAEDGNFYGIDINNGTPRFIMLNNIVLVLPNQESFSVKLRQSYNLPSPLSTAISYFDIKKAVGQGKYLIGAIYNSPSNKKSPLITELTINVGATNDWVNYNMDLTQWDFNGCSMWASWDNDDLDFSMNGYYDDGTGIYYIEFIKDNESQTNFDIRALENLNINGYSEGYYNVNTLLVSKDDGYIGVYDGGEYGTDELNWIYYCKGGSSQLEVIENFQKGTMLPFIDIDRKVQLKNINGNVFYMCKCYEKYTGLNDLYIYYGIVITENEGTKRGISTNVVADGTTWRYDFLVSNIYNLYTYNILSLDFDNNTSVGSNYSTKQIYNPTNYNGEPYENVNSLVASTGEVYDSNNRLIFARNLYNNVVTNNTTMSVLQIPNTLLNDITLSSQSLLSQTNKILTTNQQDLVKNIYETVYYNFYNTLMIEDRNTPIFKPNMTGAVRINNSTSLTTDYDNAKATKYRLNYSDDTSLVLPIQPIIQEEDSISGNNSLYITNAKEQENIISYSVDGATEQDGTPTPDNPVEVKTIPSIINLFNINDTYLAYHCTGSINNNILTLTPNGSYARLQYNFPNLIVGNKYTLTASYNNPNGNSLRIAIFEGSTEKSSTSTTTNSSGQYTITFTANSNTTIRLYANTLNSTVATPMTYYNIQIEEGSVAHEYVPYGYYSKIKVTGKNIFNGVFEQGGINFGSNGANSSSTIRIRTDFVEVTPNTTYVVSSNNTNLGNVGIGLYKEDKSYDSSHKINNGGWNDFPKSFTTQSDTKYVRFTFRKSDDSVITPDGNYEIQLELNSATTYEPYKENQILIDMSKENLFDKDDSSQILENTNINSSTGVVQSATGQVSILINCKPNTYYTITKLAGTRFVAGTSTTTPQVGDTLSNKVSVGTGTVITLKTGTNDNYLMAWVYYTNDTTYTKQEMLDSIRVYESNNPTPYHELCKIGDYKDTLSIDSSGNCVINKNVGKVVLNGGESGWDVVTSNNNRIYRNTSITDYLRVSGITCICDYFQARINSGYGEVTSGKCCFRYSSNDTSKYFYIGYNDATTLDDFKTWLSTHNTDVYYVMDTPETINLPNTKIPLFEGINHVTFVDTLNTNTSLEYDIPNVSTYTFSVLVPSDKTIDSLDILSNDELTLYHTIDTSSLENNKYYKITQNCHIE